MNQPLNGEQESNQVIEKWTKVEQELNFYQTQLGLNIHKSAEIEKVINLSHLEINALTPTDIATYGFILSQYSLFLQKEMNRHQAKNKWANESINLLLGKYGRDYGGDYTKLEERRLLLIADNSYAKALNELHRATVIILDDLFFLSKKVENMAQHLLDLAKTKSYEDKHDKD